MATPKQRKQQIIQLLDALPEDRLEEVADFLEFLRARHTAPQPTYVPVTLGRLWSDVAVDDADIAEARKEIWGSSGEQRP